MTKQANDPNLIREVGERVDVFCGIDPTTVKDLGKGSFEAVITTSNIDRQNESIQTEGVDPTTWEKTGMPVLYGHDYSGLPIGKGLSWKSFKNKMTARFQLAVDEYPFAATVAALIKGGYLNSVSIGGIVREWSEDYRSILKMEMVEFSVVSIPANSDAIITSRSLEKATGKSMDTIKHEYEDFTRKVLVDKVAGMGNDELSNGIKFLGNLMSALKESHAAHSSAGEAEPETVKRIRKVRLMASAKAVNQESERVIRLIKLK